MVNFDADRLREGAERLFEAQHPNLSAAINAADHVRGIREQIIGELPVRDATMLVVSIRWPLNVGRVLLDLRESILDPNGERHSTKYGMTIDARALPGLSAMIADAMDVLAEARRGGRR